MSQLQWTIENNCFIHSMTPVNPNRKTMSRFTGGVLKKNNACLNSSLLIRTRNEDGSVQFVTKPAPKKAQYTIDGKNIFGGYFFHHYGHFILESLSRIWLAQRYPDLPIIFAGKQSKILEFQKKILNLIGIKNEIKFVSGVANVNELIVPQPGCVINCLFSNEQCETLGVLKDGLVKNKKIWITRSKIRQHAKSRIKEEIPLIINNEEKLEQMLQDKGWFIFDPLNYDILEQLEILGSASHLAGFEGSAFHSLVLFKEYKTKIDMFGRSIRPIPDIYKNILNTKKLDFKQHDLGISLVKEEFIYDIVKILD
jgi:capsular polysaccharide biosynthesis protein